MAAARARRPSRKLNRATVVEVIERVAKGGGGRIWIHSLDCPNVGPGGWEPGDACDGCEVIGVVVEDGARVH